MKPMTIKARYSGGVLKPLEPLTLSEGEEVELTIAPAVSKPRSGWLDRTAGGWAGLVDAEKLKREIYENRLVSTRAEPRL